MHNELNRLRKIKRLDIWTDSKLLEVYSTIDVLNASNNQLVTIMLNYVKKHNASRLSVFSKYFYTFRGWSESDALTKVAEMQRKNSEKFTKKRRLTPEKYPQCLSPMTVDFWLNKGFTKDEALFEIKKQRPVNLEYWINKGYSHTDAGLQLSKYQADQGNKYTLKLKNDPIKYASSFIRKMEYWLKKTDGDVDKAKQLLKEHQATFSLAKCIKKYGEIDGRKKWEERQEKWKKKVFNTTTYIGQGKSKVSSKLFRILKTKVAEYTILEGKNEKFIHNGTHAFKYDFTILESKKIIEFNVDYWHCNPTIFKEDYYHEVKKMTAHEIWEFDKIKYQAAADHGYKVLVIWERDYSLDPEKEINKCLNFIYND